MSPDELRLVSAVRTLAASGELREQRKSRRLTLQEIADSLGTSTSTAHRWERGAAIPNAAASLRLAEIFEITAGAA
ncbi:helix-turn-helix transcriptional regulator [Streptomyces sp. NPDC047461]|uniref:helix-turn-helix domain-containing protein n=1 Tax=Streptomyces sp. NPDC047461 TaxID=3155619 RepID=UPI0033DCB755